MDYMLWIWLAVIILAGILEAGTMQLVSIWFIGGGFVALIVAMLGGPLWLQLILFSLCSVVLLAFARSILKDKLQVGKNKTNADSLVGKICIVDEPIDNIRFEGSIRINGLVWTARSANDSVTIKKGERVEVTDIQGVKLIVKKENK